MLTLCCPVCALVQEEKEVVRRTTATQPPPAGYMAQAPMHMPVQAAPMQVHMQQLQPPQQRQQQHRVG